MTSNKKRGEDALAQLDRELKSRDRAEKSKPIKVALAAAVAIVVIVAGIWFLATRSSDEEITASEESTEATTPETPEMEPLAMTRAQPLPETVTCEYPAAGDASRDVGTPPTENIPTTGTLNVTLATNQGEIGMELDRTTAPCTVNAIEHLVDNGYYDDTVCHRLTTSGIFVLQCGDPSGAGSGGPGFQFANEYPTDAMANAGADTNGSQFFLNYEDSPLAPNYTYFGQISEEGLATLDGIAETGVEGGAGDGAPAEEVRIESASLT